MGLNVMNTPLLDLIDDLVEGDRSFEDLDGHAGGLRSLGREGLLDIDAIAAVAGWEGLRVYETVLQDLVRSLPDETVNAFVSEFRNEYDLPDGREGGSEC